MANLQRASSSIRLIKPELRHAHAIASIENSPLVWGYSTLGPGFYTIQEIENFITASNSLLVDGQMRFLVELGGSDIIGCVDLYGYDATDLSAFVGIIIYPFSLQGKGYGTTAINLLFDMAHELGVEKLKVEIDPKNQRSLAFFNHFSIQISLSRPL